MKINSLKICFVLVFIVGCGAHRPSDITIPEETTLQEDTGDSWSDILPERTGDDQARYYYYLSSQERIAEGDMERAILELQELIDLDGETPYLRRELAMYYLQQQNTEAALTLLEKNVSQDPNDDESLFLYARTLEMTSRTAEAGEIYERLITREEPQESVFLRLGDLYLEVNDLENAFRVYSSLVEKYPDSYAGHFFLGKIYAVRKEYDKAEAHIKRTLELLPGLEEPLYELAEIYRQKGQIEKAIDVYKGLVEDNPENLFSSLELALLYNQNGSDDKARSILHHIGTESADDPRFYRIMRQEYLDAGRLGDAKVILEGVLETAKDKTVVSYMLGLALSGTDEKKAAIGHFMNVDKESKFYIRAMIQTALLYQETGNLDAAIEKMKSVIGEQPENQDLYMFLALFYEEKQEYENASKILQEGLRLNEKHVQMNFRLGMIYDKLGERKKLIEQMKKVIQLEPTHVNALNYLGYTYAEMNIHLDEAETLVLTALKQKPDDGYITDSLGWVYYKMGNFSQAENYLERAAQLVPDDPIIREHLGDLYKKMEQPEKALDAYRHSMMLNPENDAVIKEKINSLLEENIEP